MKKKYMFFIIAIFTFLSVGIGLTYSYFVPAMVGPSGEDKLTILKYNFKVDYVNGSNVLINSVTSSVTKTVTIENKNLATKNYLILFDSVVNTIPAGSSVNYSYTCSSSGAACSGKSSTLVPTKSEEVSAVVSIPANVTHTYVFTFTLSGSLTSQTFSTNINFKLINYLKAVSYAYNEQIWSKRANLTKITFQDHIDIPADIAAANKWDVSLSNDGSIMAYFNPANNEGFIQSNGPITANASSAGFFANMTQLLQIVDVNLLDTSQVTTMFQMFRDSNKITTVDLSGWNVKKVTNMSEFFLYCSAITSANLSGFETSAVTNMTNMFYGNSAVKNIYFNKATFTPNVTSYSQMFVGIPSDSANKGNVYVKDTTQAAWVCQRLKDATGNRHLNNLIYIIGTPNTLYTCT